MSELCTFPSFHEKRPLSIQEFSRKIQFLPHFYQFSQWVSFFFKQMLLSKSIRALNIHKAHGHDDISIRMIKICDKSLLKPSLLLLIYFFLIQLNYRITQIYGKGLLFYLRAKRMINNYLKTTKQYLQKIISNKIHYFLLEDRITNPNQSGLGAPGSCINQLLTITY